MSKCKESPSKKHVWMKYGKVGGKVAKFCKSCGKPHSGNAKS